MALGFTNSTGDYTPYVKYNAKVGRFFRVDSEDGKSVEVDISEGGSFKAVFDMENIEIGWIDYPNGAAPSYVMAPMGAPMIEKPAHLPRAKQGFRMAIKLGAGIGGDVREFSSAARSTLAALDALDDAYKAGKGENPGKLPVVAMPTTSLTHGKDKDGNKTSNYAPVFKIVSWVDRPKDLATKASPAPVTAAQSSLSPDTGSKVAAPPKVAVEAALDDDDFG